MSTDILKLMGAAACAAALFASAPAAAWASEDSLVEGNGLLSLLNSSSLTADPEAGPVTTIIQSGSGNQLLANQAGVSGGVLLLVHQIGESNLAEIEQFGAGNAASLTQLGNDNLAGVTQFGDGNGLLQIQQGDGLAIGVTQYGGAQIIITQRNN